MKIYDILIFGASYGSLLASKLLFAGHRVHFVCLLKEAQLIATEGFRVRMPVRGLEQPVEIDSRRLRGLVSASGPHGVDPASYDLVCLAMQEPQYWLTGVRELLDAVARAKVPCMSIMNMPPLPYMRRIPGLDYEALRLAYTDSTVWDHFDPGLLTLCSPDAQAIRPPEENANVLQVTLPTNFKVARFEGNAESAILQQLHEDIEAIRLDTPEGPIELPVKLKLHQSIFVPLAKWPMLLAGNYRCVTKDGPRPINQSVHDHTEDARSVYDFVLQLCISLGAAPSDLVPFDKYAAAARGLSKPSSAARALFSGSPYIERVDKLVQLVARQKGRAHPGIDATVALIDAQLESNRKSAG